MQSMLQQLVGFLAVFFGVTAAVAELRHYRQGVGEAETLPPSFDQGFGSQVAGLEHASEGTSLLSTSFSTSRVTVSEMPFAGKPGSAVRMESVTLGTLSAIFAAMAYFGNDIGEPVCGDVKANSNSMYKTLAPLKPLAVEACKLPADESNQTKPGDPKCHETHGMHEGQPDADAGSGVDINSDSGAKVQASDKALPARSRRSVVLSRSLPAPGDSQRIFRDTRQAFAEALEELENEEWESRLKSPEGTGLFRESQKAFTSALEDIESEDRLRCPSFVSVK